MKTCFWDGHTTDRIHVSPFGGIKPYAFEAHQHRDFYELVYVRRGTLDHVLSDVKHAQGPGIATLIRPGETHALSGSKVEIPQCILRHRFCGQLGSRIASRHSDCHPM